MRNAPILVEMSPELAAFVLKNCESNLGQMLTLSMNLHSKSDELSDRMVSKLIPLMEKFKELKKATEKAIKEAE